ncbi:MAG TPA: MASE1 domain-containing protein [Xanthobacteraceae bacterium]|nr:MASE1 domain-containing protein [Xanthobacteraceae bacterium]
MRRILLTYVIQLSAVGAIYYFIARFGLDLASVHPSATMISPAAGFAFAAVLVAGYRVVPAIFAAAFVVYALSRGPSYVAAATAASNALEAFVGGFLVNRLAAGHGAFSTPTGIAKFAWIAIFAAAVGATVGATVDVSINHDLVTSSLVDSVVLAKFASAWFRWWLGDLAAVLIITPVLVLWTTDRPRSFDIRPLLESGAIFTVACICGLVIFSPWTAQIPNRAPLGVLVILPLLWGALRRGPRDTATTAFILLGFVLWGAIVGGGPYGTYEESSTILLMFMIGTAMPSMALAADVALHNRSESMLRDTRLELGQVREQFAQAQKMEAVGQVTGGVAHDFNNLLTVIVGNLDIAQRHLESWTEGPAERLRRVINNAMRGAQRATTITQRLLAFSRKQPLDPKLLDVNTLLNGLTDFLRRSLGETVALDIVVTDGLWQVEADPIQLEAAILNLAINARDAMSEGGKLTIATSNCVLDEVYAQHLEEFATGEYVQIAVSDTGTGMSKDILERVFEPFFTTKLAGQGTGLGLSQVHGFVKQSRGNIQIDSKPGKGTTVKIYLPRVLGEFPVDQTARREVIENAAQTILLVEDDHDVRAYIVEILRELDFRVLEAHDAESALGIVDRNDVQVDLLLTDVVLPGMKCRQLVEELKGRQPGIRILYMSGYSRDDIVHQGHLDPGVELIQKPVTREVLADRIRALLDSSH